MAIEITFRRFSDKKYRVVELFNMFEFKDEVSKKTYQIDDLVPVAVVKATIASKRVGVKLVEKEVVE